MKYLNQIVCGDCLELMKELPDKSIDLVLTDPPYGMNYVSSRRKHKHERIKDDDNIDWIKPFLTEAYRLLKDNTHCYLFCNDYIISEIKKIARKIGFTDKRALVWVKNNHTSGDLFGDYANKTEFIVFLHKGRRELNGRRDCNILNFDRVSCDNHPTIKPVAINRYLIEKSSNVNDIVLDPFLGSGSTTKACQELHRDFIGFEINLEYCEIARKRLEQKPLF